MKLASLVNEPFELLLEIERRAKAAVAAREGGGPVSEEWIGIGFRLGTERFVAARTDVREVLPIPDHVTRVPGAKPWLRGIANVRGQLLTVVDLRSFLGAGRTQTDRHARVLLIASREVPTAVIVDEVLGFRRFRADERSETALSTDIRCERYLSGGFRRGAESWPMFNLHGLLEDEQFLNAGDKAVV